VSLVSYRLRCLNFAPMTFFLGLAVYLGTLWTSGGNQMPGPNDTRNIFACFICCMGFEFVKYFVYIEEEEDAIEADNQVDEVLPVASEVTVNTKKSS
jgi:hypothetical protein